MSGVRNPAMCGLASARIAGAWALGGYPLGLQPRSTRPYPPAFMPIVIGWRLPRGLVAQMGYNSGLWRPAMRNAVLLSALVAALSLGVFVSATADAG